MEKTFRIVRGPFSSECSDRDQFRCRQKNAGPCCGTTCIVDTGQCGSIDLGDTKGIKPRSLIEHGGKRILFP